MISVLHGQEITSGGRTPLGQERFQNFCESRGKGGAVTGPQLTKPRRRPLTRIEPVRRLVAFMADARIYICE